MMVKLNAPKEITYTGGTLSWKPSEGAAGYIVYDGDDIIAVTDATSVNAPAINTALKVRAVNRYGSQGRLGVL